MKDAENFMALIGGMPEGHLVATVIVSAFVLAGYAIYAVLKVAMKKL